MDGECGWLSLLSLSQSFYGLFQEGTGIDTNTVSMIPMAVFAITGVITAKDMQV